MKEKFSATFLLMAVLFVVCLISSNLFATKIICLWGINLPGAVIIFPVSYILNDCMAEVWGYRKARLVIWTAFAMNALVVLLGQVLVWLPAAAFWDGTEHFNYMFRMAPRVVTASLLAFLAGSTLNALVLSKMKVRDEGRRFGIRAILSSLAGEGMDSLIFMPIAFWGTPVSLLATMMLAQVTFKVCYEIVVLPLTSLVVRYVKRLEQVDVFDRGISYNPFKITDIE
ncbi:MAG: queuosine precursor transporter [Bacteroidales bacterium]|nr:queuosine precursor transporter [Bacteroidales bacterium]